MNVKPIETARRAPRWPEPRVPAHPQYPIEQSFGSDDPLTQQRLMQHAGAGAPASDDALFLADWNGLRVLARTEPVLERIAAAMRRRYGTALEPSAPAVRYADRIPVLEPYMAVLVSAPAPYLATVRRDLLARRGRITRITEGERFVLEGEAPLAKLLGYHQHVRSALGRHAEQSHVATWLCRYAPADGHGPEAA